LIGVPYWSLIKRIDIYISEMAKVKITQVKSTIDRPNRQKLTIKALGLGKINKSVEVEYTPQVAGMVSKVSHLVNVTEL
jgi:large subunit ribosomal protein L30